MAITAKPYGLFIYKVTTGMYSFSSMNAFVMLATSAYTPDYLTGAYSSDVGSAELANGNGYTTGGQQLSGLSYNYNNSTGTSVLSANDVTWATLTGTVRYAIVYNQAGALMGCIDFGADRTYAGDSLELSFTSGVVTVSTS